MEEFKKFHFDLSFPSTFTCQICSRIFDNSSDLNRHVNEVHKAAFTNYIFSKLINGMNVFGLYRDGLRDVESKKVSDFDCFFNICWKTQIRIFGPSSWSMLWIPVFTASSILVKMGIFLKNYADTFRYVVICEFLPSVHSVE